MLVKMSSSALRQTHWYEYGVRFLLGGLATVFTSLVSARFGVSIGGLLPRAPTVLDPGGLSNLPILAPLAPISRRATETGQGPQCAFERRADRKAS